MAERLTRRHGCGYPVPMGATTATLNRPFAQASPAELREVIVPEDREFFDEQYRQALDAAAETLTLDALEKFLAHWRRIAWSQTDMGHENGGRCSPVPRRRCAPGSHHLAQYRPTRCASGCGHAWLSLTGVRGSRPRTGAGHAGCLAG